MALTAATLESIRRDYMAQTTTFAQLAVHYGMSTTMLKNLRRQHGWPLRDPTKVSAKQRPEGPRAAPPQRGPRPKPATSPADRQKRMLIKRLYGAISRKLEHMEVSMSRDEPTNAADTERETRALGNMVRNFEKVQTLETDLDREAAAAAGKSGGRAEPASGDDSEHKRRQLAERIRKVRERFEGGLDGAS